MRKAKERNPVRNFQLFRRPDGSGHGDDWKYLQLEATHKSHSAQEPLEPWEFIVTPSKIPKVLWPWPASHLLGIGQELAQAKDHSQSVCKRLLCFEGGESLIV